jgi:exosome complex component RRP40
VDDVVIGIVLGSSMEYYLVDIGTSKQAYLEKLAFDNATRKNRPNLKIGSVVYALISNINDSEIYLSCQKNERVDCLGEIQDEGILVSIPSYFARRYSACLMLVFKLQAILY